MIIALPEVGEVLHGRSPIVGSAAEVDAAAGVLLAVKDEIDECRLRSSQSLEHLHALHGMAVKRIAESVHERLLPAKSLCADLSRASAAFRTHAAHIEHIHAEALTVMRETEQHLLVIQTCSKQLLQISADLQCDASRMIPNTWHMRPDPAAPAHCQSSGELNAFQLTARPVATAAWAAIALRWQWAADHIDQCNTRWAALIAERGDAEAELIAQLQGLPFASLLARQNLDSGRIAHLFGGGSVLVSAHALKPGLDGILSGRQTAQQNATAWQRVRLTDAEVKRLPLHSLLALAEADGVPFRVRDIASRQVLQFALQHPEDAHRALGLSDHMTLDQFVGHLTELDGALRDASLRAATLPGTPSAQLVTFGTHDGALTAAISLGDVDTATHIGVNVFGMGSTVESMNGGIAGAENLFIAARQADSTVQPAVITWIGYRAPAMPPSLEVADMQRAGAGAVPLSSFIDGVNATRDAGAKDLSARDLSARDLSATAPHQLTVFAHSYGSTTASQALQMTDTRVDALITYGSAGFDPLTRLEHLKADQVWATRAQADKVAEIGIHVSGRVDPRSLDGVMTFSSDQQSSGNAVTGHSMLTDPHPQDDQQVGYLNAESSAVRSMGRILATGTP